jgi:hypothetical protein
VVPDEFVVGPFAHVRPTGDAYADAFAIVEAPGIPVSKPKPANRRKG